MQAEEEGVGGDGEHLTKFHNRSREEEGGGGGGGGKALQVIIKRLGVLFFALLLGCGSYRD